MISASPEAPITIADSVTKLTNAHAGTVLIAGSHGGRFAAYVAARAGVRGVILCDAGVGKDRAGIACLDYFDLLGRPAATVAHTSARIADAADIRARGRVSHVNRAAAALGCAPGEPVAEAAARMTAAGPPVKAPPPYAEARFPLLIEPGRPEVWGLDSISLLGPQDQGRIIVAGSHGGLVGGRAVLGWSCRPRGAVFNDAGVGADRAGIARLAVLDAEGIAGATVDCRTARIGDARSTWAEGVLSHVNRIAADHGVAPGETCRQFADRVSAC